MTTASVPAPPTRPSVRGASDSILPSPNQPQVIEQSAVACVLTRAKLRHWLKKSTFSFFDQGLTSLTGFFVSFLLARWLSPEIYGAYAIAFAAYLFVCGFHNAIVLEPMSVYAGARHSGDLRCYFRSQIAVHSVLAAALSALGASVAGVTWILVPHGPLAGAILGSAIAVPFLLLLWLARRMCYVLQRPRSAILGSATSLTFVLFGLYAMRSFDRVTPFLAFLLTATGSLVGAILMLIQIANLWSRPVYGSPAMASSASATWRATLRENWSYGRWLFGNAILYPISGQVQMFLAAAFLGLGSAGVLRAMMLPAAVMTQVVSATDLLILPGFSYDFGRGYVTHMRRKALLVSSVLSGAGLCFALFLWFVGAPAEHLLFGGKFAPYVWLMPVLALIPAVNGFNSGFTATLRGSQKPHFDLLGNAVAAPVAVFSAFLFIRWWGLAGAAFSLIAGCATLALVNCCSYWHLERSTRASASVGPSPLYSEKNP